MKVMYIVMAAILTIGLIGAGISSHSNAKEANGRTLDSTLSLVEKIGNSYDNPVKVAIKRAAVELGGDYDYLMDVAYKESKLNPKAKNPASSARGLYQFINSTWDAKVKSYGKKYGITKNGRFDPYISSKAAILEARENEEIMKRALGRRITNQELYLAHFSGPNGAVRLLKASPHKSIESVLGAYTARINQLNGLTVAQAISRITKGIRN